ncbi:YceD family protein [Luteococcus sp. Sow4_B9]|uniref:YceD family protein n=1 Tax=Luteococcus sp. Sow4_B9 TaxID=3438792 RepID=UPI003F9A238E
MNQHRRLDARSPLVLEIHELARRAGTMKQVHQVVEAPTDLGIDMIGVPQGSDITLDLRLESVIEGVLVTGTADVSLKGECARCLRDFEDRESYDLQELYFYPEKEAEEDASWIEDEMIDLDPALRDAVVLELPFTPLCRDDCLGLCIECGQVLNDDPEHSHGEEIDPRWGKLSELDVSEAEEQQEN